MSEWQLLAGRPSEARVQEWFKSAAPEKSQQVHESSQEFTTVQKSCTRAASSAQGFI